MIMLNLEYWHDKKREFTVWMMGKRLMGRVAWRVATLIFGTGRQQTTETDGIQLVG